MLLLNIKNLFNGFSEGGYSEVQSSKLGSFGWFLIDLQAFQFIECKILDPPIFPFLLFREIINKDSLLPLELLQLSHIGQLAQISIMKDDQLVILGQKYVEFHVVALMDGGLDALQGVLREETAIPPMCDNIGRVFQALRTCTHRIIYSFEFKSMHVRCNLPTVNR